MTPVNQHRVVRDFAYVILIILSTALVVFGFLISSQTDSPILVVAVIGVAFILLSIARDFLKEGRAKA